MQNKNNKKAKLFKFLPYKINSQKNEIVFNYVLEFTNDKPVSFQETIILPKKSKKLEDKNIDKILKPLSIILGISYYKMYCPSKVELFFKMSKEEAEFWNIVYRKGLGEFLYRNKLDPKKIAKFPYSKVKNNSIRVKTNNSILLGIGGGKDSIVAARLLQDQDFDSFLVETQKADDLSRNVIQKIGKPAIFLNRILDPKLFIPQESIYNGHIPISAIFAFLGLFTAMLYEYKYVVVGNARTSNFGNVLYKGEFINHQWSKSAEFESLFQEYTRNFITPDITYLALLRQFNEIRIAELFSKYEDYFPVFSSCNRNFKVFKERQQNLWCGECPKCAFVFLVLAPFVNKDKLIEIFGNNLLNKQDLIQTYRDLLGEGNMKPFDCVGTFEENKVAFILASKNYKDDAVVKTVLPVIKVSDDLIKEVFSTYSAPTLPAQFKLLGLKNICILGYGKEGKVTEKYLKTKYPNLDIAMLDESLDKGYLKRQENYDFAIKTPGIPKEKVKIPYTTATNLFFAENEFSNKNLIIGITGSKGKSTTTSLIYEILKKAGKKVRLLGNIGNPMLEVLLNSPQKGEIYVVELSSYMLDDIQYSPNIAVLLNLFPEHMDYHGGFKNYYQAKNNIFKFQKEGDIALKPPFKNVKLPFKTSEVKLLGKHNIENIKVAVMVSRILKVPDSKIKQAVINFKNLPHRLEYVGQFDGVKFYDDAISTTPESTIQALEAIKDIDTIMLGGEDRGYNFKNLEKILRTKRVKNIVLFPDTGKRILKSRKGFNILETSDMREAVNFAFKNTQKGKICLLSTASPSYSVWKNFEEKGDLYQSCIKNYGKN